VKYTIQVVITTDEGQTKTRDIAGLEREDLSSTTLGLTLAEGKAILKALQEIIIAQQLRAFLKMQQLCPHCGTPQRSKGYHPMKLRTLFGTIPVKSPRLRQGSCHPHATETYSPLAALLPEHMTPELLSLETKWAALASLCTRCTRAGQARLV
jgi:hypothetical protein